MIQRIQSFYLLLIAGLMLAMLFLPLSSFTGAIDGRMFVMKALAVVEPSTQRALLATWPVLIPFAAVIVNSLFTIFCYKNRTRQIKLASANILLILACYCAFFYYAWRFMKQYPSEIQIGFALALPLVALALNLLAIKAIKKDDRLVKSLDRIR